MAPTEAEPAAARALTNAQLVAALPAAPPMMQPLATQSLLSFDEDDESVVCITSPKVPHDSITTLVSFVDGTGHWQA